MHRKSLNHRPISSRALTPLAIALTISLSSNTYAQTVINPGDIVNVDESNFIGSYTNNGSLIFEHSSPVAPFSYSWVINGTGTFTVKSSDLTLLEINGYTGTTFIDSANGPSKLHISELGSIAGDVSFVNGNGTLAFSKTTNTAQEYAGKISGNGSLSFDSGASITISGANTYTGDTILNGGLVHVDGASAFGTGTIVVTAASTLSTAGNGRTGTLNNDIVLNDMLTATPSTGQGGSLTFNGVISGNGSLNLSSPNGLILNGANTFSGGTTITNGPVTVRNNQAFGVGTVTSNNGGINGNNTTLDNRLILNSGQTQLGSFSNINGLTYNGIIEGAGELLLLSDSSTPITLTQNNTYQGGTFILSGRVIVGQDASLGSGNVTLGTTSNELQSLRTVRLANNISGPNGSPLVVSGGNDITLAGTISGGIELTKKDANTVTLTGVNTYTGGTQINGGVLRIFSDQALGQSAGTVTFNNNPTLNVAGSTTSSRDLIFATPLPAPGGGTLDIDAGTTFTHNGLISGTGVLTKTGGGGLELLGTNTYSGDTQVQGGTLRVRADSAFGQGPNVLLTQGSTLNTTASFAPTRMFSLGPGGGVFDTNAGTTLTVNTAVTGAGSLTKAGGGVLELTSANAYQGGTLINGGTLRVTADDRLGAAIGHLTINNGSTLSTGASFDSARGVSFGSGGGIVDTDAGTTLSLLGSADGVGSLTKVGTGTLVITGSNSYQGGTTLDSGTLRITADNNLGDAAGPLAINNGSTLSIGGSFGSVRPTTLGVGGGTIDTDTPATVIMNSGFQGLGGLTKAGDGLLVLAADNGYTGGTHIAAGTLQIGNGGNSGTLLGDISNDSTLAFNRTGTAYFDGLISGTGGVVQQGTGTTVLNAVNTYSGSTRVDNGTLVIGDAAHPTAALTGGAAVTVTAAGALGGYGQLASDVDNDGVVAAADAVPALVGAGTGQLTVAGTFRNRGAVHLAGSVPGNVLSVGQWVGTSGQLSLQAYLGADGSPSDKLVIHGGQASGSTTVLVSNAGGPGLATPGNGIEVIEATNGATTDPAAFALGARVEAGPYEYRLFRGARDGSAPQNWYLRSERTTPGNPGTPSNPGTPGNPGGVPSTPETPVIPEYRREVSLYAALPAMELEYGRAIAGSLHERIGDASALLDSSDTIGWTRLLTEQGQWNGKQAGIYGDGPSFDTQVTAVQAGADVVRSERNGVHSRAGVLAVLGRGRGDVDHFDGSTAGTNRFSAYTLGGYWTLRGTQGAYLDNVLQGTWYKARAGAGIASRLKNNTRGVTASLEAGYPFVLHHDWTLEPQVQVIYQTLQMQSAEDSVARITFNDVDGLTGRVGARLTRHWRTGQTQYAAWARTNVWHEFSSDAKTAFSSQGGQVPFHADQRGTWYEAALGMNVQLSQRTTLYGQLGYQKAFNRYGREAVNATVGVRMLWGN